MNIVFNTEKQRRLCSSFKELQREFGLLRAKKIQQRLNELQAAETLADVYALMGNRAGQFAIVTQQPFRMIFEPAHRPVPLLPDGGINRLQVIAIRILEVDINYHD